ncbi:MAG: transporter substrate-binding protein [Bacilli bacterium]|nr:transporter substrate-binding protein [Bacilli bacterium]
MLRKVVILTLSLVFSLVLFIGCSKQASNQQNDSTSNEPISLLFYTAQNGNYANDDNFQAEIGNFIKQKFPNITIEHIHKQTGTQYADLITQGKVPDIVLEASANTNSAIIQNGLNYDVSPLIQKYHFDLNRIDPALIDQIKKSGDGKIYGLPFNGSNFVLFYNKDIFDKFGVPYPKNGMTWDDIYDLAKKLTVNDNGVQYYGFEAHPGLMMQYNQLSQSWLDKNDNAAVNSDVWRNLFENLKRFYNIPGNVYTSVDDFPKGQIAMDLHVSEKVVLWPQQNTQMSWDIASAPTFKDQPGVGLQPNEYSLYISSGSPHKDAAFQVISYLLSDDVQMQLSKRGFVTPLVNKTIQQAYGQDNTLLKGKNISAIYYDKYATPIQTDSFTYPSNVVGTAFTDMLKNNQDVNTALRQLEDSINKKVTDLKNQQQANK